MPDVNEPWPDPPVNIRLVLRDGTEIPVDSHYVGQSPEGQAMWNVLIDPDLKYTNVKVEELPGRTSVAVIRDYTQ